MSLAIASGIVASIVPFDLTVGIAAVASVMLTLFVLVMVFLAVAPLFSSAWVGQRPATPSAGAEPSDD